MSCVVKNLLQISYRFFYPKFEDIKRYECCQSMIPKKLATIPNIRNFIVDCLTALRTPSEHAQIVADASIAADVRGIFSHGLNRLEMYVGDIKCKVCDPAAVPEVEKESCATALVSGKNGLGAVVGRFCMELAMEKAHKQGIGLVTCNGSNNYGTGTYLLLDPIEKGFIGMVFSNAPPLVVPTGAKRAVYGTNPIAVGARGLKDDYINIDMATSTVALGKIQVYQRKGQPIPKGWALDEKGSITTNPTAAFKAKALLPLSEHKGFGLGLAVEILSGILSGSAYGHRIPHFDSRSEPKNIGHCFIAVDPKHFECGYRRRLSDLKNIITSMEPVCPDKPVLFPGQVEQAMLERTEKQGGVFYVEDLLKSVNKIAKDLCVAPLQVKEVPACG